MYFHNLLRLDQLLNPFQRKFYQLFGFDLLVFVNIDISEHLVHEGLGYFLIDMVVREELRKEMSKLFPV